MLWPWQQGPYDPERGKAGHKCGKRTEREQRSGLSDFLQSLSDTSILSVRQDLLALDTICNAKSGLPKLCLQTGLHSTGKQVYSEDREKKEMFNFCLLTPPPKKNSEAVFRFTAIRT